MRFKLGHEELRRIRIPLGFILGIVLLWLSHPTIQTLVRGAAVSMLGLSLRIWAIGHLVKDQKLATTGPYAHTRNPLYLGNLLIGLGLSIASGSWWVLAIFSAYFLLIYPSTMRAEENHLTKLFGDQYRDYRGRVPLFLPRVLPYRQTVGGSFEWRRYWLHREYRAGIGFLVVLLILTLFVRAAAQGTPALAPSAPARNYPLPFESGETLVYQVRFSRMIFSGMIGKLTFSFQPSTEAPLTDHYMLRAEAISDGIWPALFGMDVHDIVDSFVNPIDFAPDRTRKHLSEGERKSFELSVLRRSEEKLLLIKRDLSKPDAAPQLLEASSPRWVQDILSAVYYFRAQTLQTGTRITIPILDSGKLSSLEVEVQGVEEIDTYAGRISALRVMPRIFGKERLVEREGELILWVSNDPRHIPVMAKLSGGFGVVSIRLKEIKGAAPLSPASSPPGGSN